MDSIIKKITDSCVRCSKCMDECMFLGRYGKPFDIAGLCSEKDKRVMDIAFGCSLCRLCEAVCPVELNPAELFIELRKEAVRQDKVNFSRYSGLLAYEKKGTSRRYSWYGLPQGCDSVFFPGCTLSGTRPAVTSDLYRLLKKAVPGMGIVLDCCTKPSHDLGREDFFNKMFGEMKTFLADSGVKNIYTACPNCYRVFKDHGSEFMVKTVYELIAQKGLIKPEKISGRVTVHDPCVIRFEKEVHSAVRELTESTGLDIEEMEHSKEKTLCCGEGGSVGSVSLDLVRNWRNRRLEETRGLRVITYCAGCAGKLSSAMPASHILDLLFNPGAVLRGKENISKPPFTYWNRLNLKKRLKKETGLAVTRERDISKIK